MASARTLLAFCLALLLALASPAAARPQPPEYRALAVTARCPFGYTLSVHQPDFYSDDVHRALAAGQFASYHAGEPLHPLGTERYEMVRIVSAGGYTFTLGQSVATIAHVAHERPGALWLIGNEPDNRWQDNARPEVFAAGWLSASAVIRAADPTARLATGGVTEWTAAREAWWSLAWNAGVSSAPPDAWSTHTYVLNECASPTWGMGYPVGVPGAPLTCREWPERASLDIVRDDLSRMRAWLNARGQAQPVIVSEYGVLGSSDLPYSVVANNVLTGGMALMQDAGVSVWLLYSLDDDGRWGWGASPHLVDPDTGALTPLGNDWARYVRNHYAGCAPGLPVSARAFLPLGTIYAGVMP